MIDSPIILDERTLLNLDSKKTKTKPTLQTITIKIKNEKLGFNRCYARNPCGMKCYCLKISSVLTILKEKLRKASL